MGQVSKLHSNVIKHLKASSSEAGVHHAEITVQYIYPTGLAGTYVGNVILPFSASSKYPDEFIIPSSGFLRSGMNQSETIQRATFIFYLKAVDTQSYGVLLTFDKGIKHTARNFNVGFQEGYCNDLLFGDFTISPAKPTGKVMISYNLFNTKENG